METRNTIFNKEHQNKWVALSKDRKKILGYSEDLSELTKKLGKGNGISYMKVPRSDISFAF